MSAVDNKKAKRRRSKNNTVTKSNASSNVSNNTPQGSHFSLGENGEAEKLEKLMDASDDSDMPLPTFPRGPNPYLDRERCLICGCERQDPPQAEKILAEMDGDAQKNTDVHELTQLPLWVCPSCRRAADSELEKKSGVDINLEQELHLDTSSLPFLPEVSLGGASEPTTPNGTLCTCEACTERRYHDWQIEAEHERETQELQKCWTDLRTIVRTLYGADDPALSEEDGVKIKDLVCRLCSRDPHQLFLRLESQVREFVIEKKVRLLKQLNCGYKSPPQAKEFISLLLDEYNQLCLASRLTAEYLTDLKEHIKKFNVTWELHNKHLFQSIVYTDPAIHNSLHLVIDQLRGAASKESYNEDTYPNLLHRFLKFQDEMSVILVVWRDCQQLIEAYNEEQTALKVKQKWLKEDWEFFKAQRKLLEQQVLKKQPKDRLSHSMEVQFTETMRNMLTGTKPAHEECFCPRCNRKRCTCDECTITHMITCGIINPDALENNNHTHTFNFPHDPSRYVIDVDPPSMSSTSSSSGSSSPIMVERNRLTLPFENEENEDIPEEIDSQSEDEEDDGDEDEDDEDDEDEDDEDDVEDDEVEGAEGSQESSSAGDGGSGGSPTDMDLGDKRMQAWVETEALKLMEKTDTCDCHHCVTQTQAEQLQKVEDNQCQCHVCLQQQGQTVSTSLPQHVPITPRPADLHIYPHIHGSPGLHSLQARNMRSILPPQLYDLHGPLRQAKLPVKLDFDNPENIQDHLYHAYGDWDNTPYDPRVVIGGYRYGGGLGSDLLPPPPLTTNSPYPPEPLSSVSQTATTTTTCTTTSALNNHLANAITKSMDRSNDHQVKPVLSDSCAKCSEPVSSLSSSLSSSGSQPHGPPCTRPATLGGNTQVQQTGVKQPHTHCKKHVNGKTTSQPSHNHSLQAHGGLQGVQSDLLKNSPRNKDELSRPLRNSSLNPHPCSHANTRNASAVHQTQGDSHAGCCPSSVPMATTVNNVSVGTSTVCTDPDCDAHHDDNCDSIDDSCSEQSSSTSTSNNQKEGSKYCDCCYCEFFGHGNPPVAQTSKNYAEMRERLRRRLKRKQTEAKTGEDRGGLTELTMESSCSHSKLADPLEMKGLEELLRFINGTEESKKEEKAQSSKAAKRARRKQRLAEEKAREEDRRQMEEEEKKKKIKEEKKKKEGLLRHLEERFSSSSEFESSTGSLKKKKGKHKEKSETILSAPLPTSVPPTQLSCRSVPRPIESAKPAKVETIVERKQEVIKGRDNTPSPKQVLKTSGSGSAPTTPTKDLRQQAMTDKSHTMTPDRQRRAKTAQRITPSNDTAVSYQPKPNTTLQPTPTILSKQPAQPAKQTAQQKPLQNNVPKTTNNTRKAIPPQPSPIQNHVDSQPEVDLSKKGKKKVVTPLVQPTASQPLPKSTHKQNGSILNSVQIVQAPSHSNGKFVDVTMGKDAKITSNGVVSKGNGELLIRPGKNHKLADKKQETGAPEQNKIGKGKKNKKKNKGADGCVDEIFMPRSESDLENGDMDEVERELEEFKRFCFDSPQPQKKEKLQVNFNLKDIFSKKKSGLGCS
ncbi:protein FAM193A-like isoform X3 [Haliotis rufescens]|uniref:protein FAM193A-like isoform X3 n=1 Tax=Haliotis rufescens TaxID=6454 RepID=UPI00201EAB7B|nr:protein FAM193A-like isoform X3 [Haliotis rufescens]